MTARPTRRALSCLIALLALAAAPSAAAAQSVIEQLTTAATEMMTNNGMSRRSSHDGSLAQGRSTEISVNIKPGQQILIAGFCDEDCSDLDLKVTKDGETLGEDLLEDDAPMVSLANFAGGTVTVRVDMPGCSVAPCAFRVMVFGK